MCPGQCSGWNLVFIERLVERCANGDDVRSAGHHGAESAWYGRFYAAPVNDGYQEEIDRWLFVVQLLERPKQEHRMSRHRTVHRQHHTMAEQRQSEGMLLKYTYRIIWNDSTNSHLQPTWALELSRSTDSPDGRHRPIFTSPLYPRIKQETTPGQYFLSKDLSFLYLFRASIDFDRI